MVIHIAQAAYKDLIYYKTDKNEFDLEPEDSLCSICKMQVLIAGDGHLIQRARSAFKRSFVFNEKTLE